MSDEVKPVITQEATKVEESGKVSTPILKEEDKKLDKVLDSVTLDKSTEDIVNKIIKAESTEELQRYTDLFNANMAKKNTVRMIKLQTLIDHSIDQGEKRMTEKPDQFSNKDILEYMKVTQALIDSTEQKINGLKNAPSINIIKSEKNELNVNVGGVDGLSRESKEKVIEAVTALLKQAQKDKQPEQVVEAEIKEEKK